jgi:hypothetical protein
MDKALNFAAIALVWMTRSILAATVVVWLWLLTFGTFSRQAGWVQVPVTVAWLVFALVMFLAMLWAHDRVNRMRDR